MVREPKGRLQGKKRLLSIAAASLKRNKKDESTLHVTFYYHHRLKKMYPCIQDSKQAYD